MRFIRRNIDDDFSPVLPAIITRAHGSHELCAATTPLFHTQSGCWPCSIRTLTCDLQLSRRLSPAGSIIWSDRWRLFDSWLRASPGGAAAVEHPGATTVIVVGRWSWSRVGDTAWTRQEVLDDRTDRKDPRETPEKEWRRLGRRSSPSSSSSSSTSSYGEQTNSFTQRTYIAPFQDSLLRGAPDQPLRYWTVSS